MNKLAKYSLAVIAIAMVFITIRTGRVAQQPEAQLTQEAVTENEY